VTQRKLAEHVGCDIKVINRIVNGRTSVGAVDRCVNRHSVSAGKTVETGSYVLAVVLES